MMLGFGWLALRQAKEALKSGRLEEAQRLLAHPVVQGSKRTWEVLAQLAQAFADRGERSLRQGNPAAAWSDLLRAEQVDAAESQVARLRQALTRRGLVDLRGLLEAGEPARAVEAAAQLRDRLVHQPELEPLEEAARDWAKAGELADRGEFAQAQTVLARVRRLLPGSAAGLERFQNGLAERHRNFTGLVVQLHEAARQARWPEVLDLSERILALAPQHPEARKVRSRAWKAIEPATVVGVRPKVEPVPGDVPAVGPGQQFLLWVDGIGGYLICLGNRVTFGQATPESCVDVPLFADVSRLHAAATRDTEGYLLEAFRPTQVNGHATDKTLLRSGDRVTLGACCQFQFRQPVPVSASARIDLVSGHRLWLAVDAVLLMADTLVLGPDPQAHVTLPEVASPVILFRQKDGLGVRHAGNLTVNGQRCGERSTLEPGVTVAGDDFSLTLEAVSGKRFGGE
jgi:tetratricopeptide (TPR) repeat protein